MKTMKRMLLVGWVVVFAALCLVGCAPQREDTDDENWDTPPAMYYEGGFYDLRYLMDSEIDVQGRELELLGKAVYAGANPNEFTENFQSNLQSVHGAEVYRQTNAQTVGLLILKIGEKYYEIGSGSY
ncbi:MAG: hypothetical protein IJY66_04685 [Clostridia bacterium]|nr:hypothetical protein [Clostridia bacterium]